RARSIAFSCQAEDGIRGLIVTGVQTCALPIYSDVQRRQDERELGALGYAQELFRTIGGFSNFALSFSIISILTGAVTLYQHGLVDRKSTRLNSSHDQISYAVFCLKKKKKKNKT